MPPFPRQVVIAASLHSDPPTVKIDTEFTDLGERCRHRHRRRYREYDCEIILVTSHYLALPMLRGRQSKRIVRKHTALGARITSPFDV